MRRLLRSLAIDVGPLRRHREFRLLYTGQAVSFAGSMITYVAIPFQVYDLTRSTLAVGLLGARGRAAEPRADPRGLALRSLAAGAYRQLRGRHHAMLFGIPIALFPAVADSYGGPEALGLLYAAGPAGAVVLTLASGWVARVARHGKAIALSAGAYGAAIALFGLADALPLALAALAAAGAADMASVIVRQTLWNQTIPDHMRGRMAGIEQLSYSVGPTLGTARSGAVASVTTVPFSIVSGGAVCVVGTVALCSILPRFWRYRAQPVSA